MNPDVWTDELLAEWRLTLRNIAAHWAERWAWRQNRRQLVDDLESVGWIVLLERGLDDPRLRWEIQNAMLDALARWLYGVDRSHSQGRTVVVVPLTSATLSRTLLPSDHVALKQAWERATPVEQAAAERLLWPMSGREHRRREGYERTLADLGLTLMGKPRRVRRGSCLECRHPHHEGRRCQSLTSVTTGTGTRRTERRKDQRCRCRYLISDVPAGGANSNRTEDSIPSSSPVSVGLTQPSAGTLKKAA